MSHDLSPRSVSVRQSAMDVFAEILEDPNPIHLDPAATAAAGLGERTINQGPANFGYVIDMLRENFPGAAIGDLNVRLLANVCADDRVTAAGRVEANQDGRLRCAVWLDVEGGPRAIEGTATVVLPEESDQ
jgi:3-hydroxybutyryl-CoA dehydratase